MATVTRRSTLRSVPGQVAFVLSSVVRVSRFTLHVDEARQQALLILPYWQLVGSRHGSGTEETIMRDTSEMTGAEAGLTTERQIQVALQTVVDNGGAATISQLYDAISQNMPLDTSLSQQGRDTLRSLISRQAVEQGYIEPYDSTRPGWRITAKGRAYLDEIRTTLGTEGEDTLPIEPEDEPSSETEFNTDLPSDTPTARPFDSSAIRVDQRMMSIFQVMRKINSHDIDLRPEFQRNFVWNLTRQSRLIESILLRIPLPAFYLDATLDDRWLVVDGLQRLSTLESFFNKNVLILTNLEFLTEHNGKSFSDMPRSLQRQIEDTELNLYIIRPDTPPNVKFTIFSRVNTGGLVLMPQEIRHALFQGRATRFLSELAQLPEFLNATTGSISPLRMDDRECALRFLAFCLTDYKRYGKMGHRDKNGRLIQQNLDGFLSDTMERISRMNESQLDELRDLFRMAMIRCEAVFGGYAFRKFYALNARRSQISKPLFEVWSVSVLPYSKEKLEQGRGMIIEGFLKLMRSVEFNKAISLGTGSPRAVQYRFSAVETLLREVVQ